MSWSTIPIGTALFVDANIFVYAFSDDPTCGPACTDLLERVEFGELQGFLSASVFSDVAYRLLTLEACKTYGWDYARIGRRLRRHPAEVQKLTEFKRALTEIAAAGFRIHPVTDANVLRAAQLSIHHGLLSNDALVVAVMEEHSLCHLATNDADFDRVPTITRYSPL